MRYKMVKSFDYPEEWPWSNIQPSIEQAGELLPSGEFLAVEYIEDREVIHLLRRDIGGD